MGTFPYEEMKGTNTYRLYERSIWEDPPNDKTYPELAEWVQIQITSYLNENMPKERENLLLSNWVRTQRARLSTNTILEKKICLLDSIGFDWKLVFRSSTGAP